MMHLLQLTFMKLCLEIHLWDTIQIVVILIN